MHHSVLVKALRDLKLQIEESITFVEAQHEDPQDDTLADLVEQCQKSFTAMSIAIHSAPNSASASNGHKITDRKAADSHLHEKTTEQVQDDFDNLDGLEFDDFFDNPEESKMHEVCTDTSLKENELSFKQDNLPDAKPMQGTDLMSKPVVQVDDDYNFSYSDFDDDDLNLADCAGRSSVENIPCFDDDEPDDIHQPTDPVYQEVLKQYFGYSSFRPMQWKIINSVLNDKRDNCVIMATGYGKSLTFQFPSVFTKRVSIIICPLISLMEDQVHGLKASNIEACFLGSAQSDMVKVKMDMFSGKYRLVYVTPEFATTAISDFKKLDLQVGIDLIAIDEAHCVSQWGHDFRESYRRLGILKQEFPKIPILAVTATATFDVQKDICSSLKLVNPNMTCTGFDRPNLFLSVDAKHGDIASDLRSVMQKVGSNKFSFDGPTIIYCPTKKVTEEVTSTLNALGVPCLSYHASLSFSARRKAHHSFLNDDIQVVVATVAFGMGIDKPDIRRVIHYGAPKDIESYYQEIGRAGRDGLPSVCTTLFSRADFNLSRHFISAITSDKFRDHKLKMLHKMEQYLSTTTCRRRILLSYFESKNLEEIGGTQNCCDNCRSRLANLQDGKVTTSFSEKSVDYRKEATDLFKAVEATGNRFGLQVPVQVLIGSERQKVQLFKSNKMFGAGKYKSTRFWTALGRALIYEGYLREKAVQGGFGSTVETTQKAKSWLSRLNSANNECHLYITPTGELLQEEELQIKKSVTVSIKPSQESASGSGMKPSTFATLKSFSAPGAQLLPPVLQPSAPPKDEKTTRLENDLYVKLLKTRNSISQETGFTPHNIASNKVLLDMAKFRPSTRVSLLKLEDFSEVKADRFGDKFLELIKSFCNEHDLKMDDFPDEPHAIGSDDSIGSIKDTLMKISETQRQSYILFAIHNHTLEEVASRRGLKVSTVVTHLCEAMKEGLHVDIRRLGVTEKIENLITKAIWAPPVSGGINSLTKIKDQLPDYVEYNHIKVVIALLVQKHGQERSKNDDVVLCGSASLNQEVVDIDIDGDQKFEFSPAVPSGELRQCLKRHRTQSPSQHSPPPVKSSQSLTTSPESNSCEPILLQKSTSDTKASCLLPSQSQSSQSFSQSSSQASTRKLPSWITESKNKPVFTKKIKSNSLFK
ncbi:hypothetical protein BsWGS_00781 [Bradybaena similaris]